MTRIAANLIKTFILILAAAVCGYSQRNFQCDFSKYKPIVIVNPSPDAVIKTVTPEYPKFAKAVRAGGQVVVIILVDKKGNVKKACSNVGHPLLQPAAIKTALKWKFKPNLGIDFGRRSKLSRRYLQTYLSFSFQ